MPAVQVQVQKVKHLQFEHAAALAALQLEKEQALKDAAAVAAARQDELMCVALPPPPRTLCSTPSYEPLADCANPPPLLRRSAEKRAVQAALAASENALAAEVGKVQLEAARAGTALREELAAASEAAAAAAASSLAAEREAAEARRARELDAASSRREAQVSALEKNHAQSLGELKDWYDATTSEQLGAIKRLGGELVEYRRKEAALEAAVTELTAENKRLADVAYKATLEAEGARRRACGQRVVVWVVLLCLTHALFSSSSPAAVLRPGAASSDKDKAAAAAATARAAKAERALKQAEWDLEVKTQLVVALAASKEELQRALDAAEATNRRPGRLLSNAEASLAR